MDDLTYELRALCRRNRDGSRATQADRLRAVTLIGRQLREAGFRNMRASSLNIKHVRVLVAHWQREELAVGTIKNRLACLRWCAEKLGKPGLIPADNKLLAIPERQYISNKDKSCRLGGALERIADPYVRMSLQLQEAFDLEESIKFQPSYADRGDYIALEGSWTKGGRPREVPITTPEQRAVLDRAHALAGAGSLIPPHKTYIQQRNTYDGQCKAAGLSRMHGLRHLYAQGRFEAQTGWRCPAAGGPVARALTPAQRMLDFIARQTISYELGHERPQITAVYLGR